MNVCVAGRWLGSWAFIVAVAAQKTDGAGAQPSLTTLVNITTEAAMHDTHGTVILDCLEPHITKFGDTYYAYGYAGGDMGDGPEPYATTTYSSRDLQTWSREASFPMLNGSAGGQPNAS